MGAEEEFSPSYRSPSPVDPDQVYQARRELAALAYPSSWFGTTDEWSKEALSIGDRLNSLIYEPLAEGDFRHRDEQASELLADLDELAALKPGSDWSRWVGTLTNHLRWDYWQKYAFDPRRPEGGGVDRLDPYHQAIRRLVEGMPDGEYQQLYAETTNLRRFFDPSLPAPDASRTYLEGTLRHLRHSSKRYPGLENALGEVGRRLANQWNEFHPDFPLSEEVLWFEAAPFEPGQSPPLPQAEAPPPAAPEAAVRFDDLTESDLRVMFTRALLTGEGAGRLGEVAALLRERRQERSGDEPEPAIERRRRELMVRRASVPELRGMAMAHNLSEEFFEEEMIDMIGRELAGETAPAEQGEHPLGSVTRDELRGMAGFFLETWIEERTSPELLAGEALGELWRQGAKQDALDLARTLEIEHLAAFMNEDIPPALVDLNKDILELDYKAAVCGLERGFSLGELAAALRARGERVDPGTDRHKSSIFEYGRLAAHRLWVEEEIPPRVILDALGGEMRRRFSLEEVSAGPEYPFAGRSDDWLDGVQFFLEECWVNGDTGLYDARVRSESVLWSRGLFPSEGDTGEEVISETEVAALRRMAAAQASAGEDGAVIGRVLEMAARFRGRLSRLLRPVAEGESGDVRVEEAQEEIDTGESLRRRLEAVRDGLTARARLTARRLGENAASLRWLSVLVLRGEGVEAEGAGQTPKERRDWEAWWDEKWGSFENRLRAAGTAVREGLARTPAEETRRRIESGEELEEFLSEVRGIQLQQAVRGGPQALPSILVGAGGRLARGPLDAWALAGVPVAALGTFARDMSTIVGPWARQDQDKIATLVANHVKERQEVRLRESLAGAEGARRKALEVGKAGLRVLANVGWGFQFLERSFLKWASEVMIEEGGEMQSFLKFFDERLGQLGGDGDLQAYFESNGFRDDFHDWMRDYRQLTVSVEASPTRDAIYLFGFLTEIKTKNGYLQMKDKFRNIQDAGDRNLSAADRMVVNYEALRNGLYELVLADLNRLLEDPERNRHELDIHLDRLASYRWSGGRTAADVAAIEAVMVSLSMAKALVGIGITDLLAEKFGGASLEHAGAGSGSEAPAKHAGLVAGPKPTATAVPMRTPESASGFATHPAVGEVHKAAPTWAAARPGPTPTPTQVPSPTPGHEVVVPSVKPTIQPPAARPAATSFSGGHAQVGAPVDIPPPHEVLAGKPDTQTLVFEGGKTGAEVQAGLTMVLNQETRDFLASADGGGDVFKHFAQEGDSIWMAGSRLGGHLAEQLTQHQAWRGLGETWRHGEVTVPRVGAFRNFFGHWATEGGSLDGKSARALAVYLRESLLLDQLDPAAMAGLIREPLAAAASSPDALREALEAMDGRSALMAAYYIYTEGLIKDGESRQVIIEFIKGRSLS